MHRAFRFHNEASTNILHRGNFIHSGDVYNIFRKVFEGAYKRYDDQKASVKLWLNHLETKNYSVFIDNDYDSSFAFGFCSTWQAFLLAETKDFSLDATHNTTAFKDDLLYTLVIWHAEAATGCPVAYLFTIDRSFLASKSLALPFKTFYQSLFWKHYNWHERRGRRYDIEAINQIHMLTGTPISLKVYTIACSHHLLFSWYIVYNFRRERLDNIAHFFFDIHFLHHIF